MSEYISLALAGVGEFGAKCLEALTFVQGFRLVAVCDRNASAAEQVARKWGVPAYPDPRLLISQAKPAAVIVATPPAAAPDLIRLATRHNVHIIRPAPLARTLDEAVALVSATDDADLTFSILSPRRFNDGYRNLLSDLDLLGPLFLARSQQFLNWGKPFGWRGDKASAGGGVLLEAGYDMLDLLVLALGLPEEVYAITGRKGRPYMQETNGEVEPLGIYDTDDTAALILRYPEGMAATAVASWVTSPASEQITLHGQRGTASCDAIEYTLRDIHGQVTHREPVDDRITVALAAQFAQLARSLAGKAKRCSSSAREHLLTLAVVEAAYLSNRTGQPENPRRLLEARGISPADCRRPGQVQPAG